MATSAVPPQPAPAPVSAPQGSPEPVQSTPQPQAQPAEAAAAPAEPALAPEPNQAAREALYQRYYASTQPSQPEPVQAPAGGEPPAQGEPAPAPEPSAPAPGSGPDDIESQFAAFEQRIAQMIQQAVGGAAPSAEQPPAGTPPPVAEPGDWLELLRQGKVAEGEQALAKKISAALEDQLANRTLEAVRVEGELTKFVQDLRTANQDILDLEDWIGQRSRASLDAVMAAGKIQSSADYIREYKAAVTAAVDDARKLAQKFRAAGRSEALTTKQSVLSASTLTPNPVDAARQTAQPQAPQAETADDYLQKRIADQMARKGMAV